MKGSRRSRRPYSRPVSQLGQSGLGGSGGLASRHDLAAGGAEHLSSMAGLAVVERLEPRQLLFSLTITPSDLVDNEIGEVRAVFGVTIPVLQTQEEIEDGDPEVVTEDFSGYIEDDLTAQLPVPTGTVFESGLRITHNITIPQRMVVLRDAGLGNEEAMATQMVAGEQFTLMLRNANSTNNTNIAMQQMQMDFLGYGNTVGLDSTRMTVTLFFRGQVVRTLTGDQLRALSSNPGNPGIGTYTFTTGSTANPVFDQIRFSASGLVQFGVDNVTMTTPAGNFVSIVESRVFGVEAVFSGPVGATIRFLDLYGRDIVQTTALGTIDGLNITLVDPDDNGIPNFNDGIGRIEISGADLRTSLSMVGGRINNGEYERIEDVRGLGSDFEGGGFGFLTTVDGVVGLPESPMSVIIGSPWVRPQNNYNPDGLPAGTGGFVTTGFNRADQGIFTTDGSSVGSISIHGAVFGSSKFNGAVQTLAIAYPLGSFSVQGDLGQFIGASDAGIWVPDADSDAGDIDVDPINKTGSVLFVGRTLGEVAIAGRSLIDITVLGDRSDPTQRAMIDSLRYREREVAQAILLSAGVEASVNAQLDRTSVNSIDGGTGQAYYFGNGFFRNDTALSSEFINRGGTSVIISGNVGFRDPVNTAEDLADVYGFVVDGTTDVRVEISNATAEYVRVVDQDGRILAANSAQVRGNSSAVFTFKPNAPGQYFLVVTIPGNNDGGETSGSDYEVTISGLAPVTFGALRTGASLGQDNVTNGLGNDVNIAVLEGSMGAVRVGTGIRTSAGTDADPTEYINTDVDDVQALMTWGGGTLSVSGSLYNITTGSDLNIEFEGFRQDVINVFIGGDFGNLVTGLAVPAGAGNNDGLEGDLGNLNMTVGGRVGVIDVRGSIGVDRDAGISSTTGSRFTLRTGNEGGDGSIGMFRVGGHIFGPSLSIRMSPGSIMGGMLVSQDIGDTEADSTNIGIWGGTGSGLATFNTGFGSDVRFVDIPQIDINSANTFLPIIGGQVLELVDDGGAKVRISVAGAPSGVQVGLVRFVPVDGSQGVAIGEISVDLSGAGQRLDITSDGRTGTPVSIGRINITNAVATSSVSITGAGEIDVWSIEQTGGVAMETITNATPLGDLVAIDVLGIQFVQIGTGSLGRTEVVPFGPKLIGPFLGLASGLQATVGGALGILAATVDGDWAGQTSRPTDSSAVPAGGAFLDDIGSLFDPYLNGLVVRSGNVTEVRVDGTVGDVILQGGTAELINLIANADGITPAGAFEGIVGSVYAAIIARVDIGSGLAQRTDSPLSTTGIFASNEIRLVIGNRIAGATISSTISAFDAVVDAAEADGIGTIELAGGGRIIDAYISASNLDAFWNSQTYGDDRIGRANLRDIITRDASIFRTEIFADTMERVQILGGVFDAVLLQATGDVGFITADEYRNSTLTGTAIEYFPNAIIIDGNLDRLTVNGTSTVVGSLLGTIKDLTVDVVGNLNTVSASDLTRVSLDVDGTILSITTSRVRASNVTAGELRTMTASQSVVSSTFNISGPINSFTATDSIINTSINVTGPRGRLDLVSAANLISGSIASAGPIGTIRTTAGDIRASVRTTTAFGTVTLLAAARDLDVVTDISAGIATMTAGRHIGNQSKPSVILVRGNLGSVTAGGTLYNDIRIGNNLTGSIVLGGVSAKPGSNLVGNGSIIAFGRLASVTVNGDFGGSIISWSGGIGSVAINNGSFYKDRTIAAYDGSIDSLVITSGHLLGNVHADRDITSLRVVGSADGIFGDVGINPALSASVPYDALRNRLPAGVAPTIGKDGPSITAGRNITSFVVTDGSIFEATVWAGRSILSMQVNGGASNNGGTTSKATMIAAGDFLGNIAFSGGVNRAFFGAGVMSFGADNLPGGTGANADTVKSGTMNGITVGALNTVDFVAGVNAGADGLYIGGDDRTAIGVSLAQNIVVTGSVVNARLTSDGLAGGIDARIVRASAERESTDAEFLAPGETQLGTVVPAAGLTVNVGGVSTRITLSGPGRAAWDASTRTISFTGTSGASALRVEAAGAGVLNNLRIVGRDDTGIGSITVVGTLSGDSAIKVDADLNSLVLGTLSTTGQIIVGGTLGSLTTADFFGGHVQARTITATNISGFFGNTSPGVSGEASISALELGSVSIGKTMLGLISSDRSIASVVIGGSVNVGFVRAGDSIGTFTAASLNRGWISARDAIGTVSIAGDMFDSSIMAGVDLGADGRFGGSGADADAVTTGTIGTVSVGGNFRESDIVAGISRGSDGFFGNADDLVAEGRSTIGSIVIGGNEVGSNVNSESYQIGATGSIGAATIGGVAARNQANLKVGVIDYDPVAIQVTNLQVDQASRIFYATMTFNLPIDVSTLSRALSVSEVRGTGSVKIRLIEGIDYTLAYDASTRRATVMFSRAVTERNLPQVVGVPGPGVFRFELEQSILRGSLVNGRLDGDGDGFIGVNDNYSDDTFVGDAGDKLTPGSTTTGTGFGVTNVDFYGPFNLDIVMDNNRASDGVADANKQYTIRGSIGDHPDTNIDFFKPGGDADLYRVTLQAGQILRLGQMQGSALLAGRYVIDPTGAIVSLGASSSVLLSLPVPGLTEFDLVSEQAFLIKQTGVYTIAVTNALNLDDPSVVTNIDSIPGAVGTYRFSVEIFDDGDSGFNASTNAGDGNSLVYAPAPIDFAGPDRVFGTADDITTRIVGSYTFVYGAGADGVKGTADDIVTGTSPDGVSSIYETQTIDGIATPVRTVSVSSAIGPNGHAGIPGDVWADVDIFHLNNKQAIAPGTRLRFTVKLADLGADLGSRNQRSVQDIFLLSTFFDYRGSVQFGLFDTTNSTGIDDGVMVFSPTDFTGREGVPGVLADNGTNSYGFDENGDFFIDFVTSGAIGSDGTVPAKYALYLQGAFNTDYQIQIQQFGGTVASAPREVQNILLETRGGSIDWLEAGGLTTNLAGFDARILGYSGNVADGRTVDKFLLDNIVSQLTSAYAAAGVDVRISTNPADFEFQDYSTVFLTSSFDDLNFINSGFAFFGFATLTNQPFGYSERSDPLNTDKRDEAVVFVPSASILGYNQSQAELESLSQALTAAVGRRVGELLGLRTTADYTSTADADIMASNSVSTIPGFGQPYRYSNSSRLLSTTSDPLDDTNFFLGRQRNVSLLDRILAD